MYGKARNWLHSGAVIFPGARFWRGLWEPLLAVVYPRLCAATGVPLVPGERAISQAALRLMPPTGFELRPTANPAYDAFAGRLCITGATAAYTFEKGAPIQRALWALKYNRHPAVGEEIGAYYGRQLRGTVFASALAVVPIPLHPRKLRKRGYNQATAFAGGIGAALGIPVLPNALKRTRHTQTQTGLNRAQRQQNVAGVFAPTQALPARVLVVDDVLTTGATLDAAIAALEAAGVTHVGVVTIAYAPE